MNRKNTDLCYNGFKLNFKKKILINVKGDKKAYCYLSYHILINFYIVF